MSTRLIKKGENNYTNNPSHINVEIKPIVDKNISNNIKTLLVKVKVNGEIVTHTHDTLEVFHLIKGNGIALINGEYLSVEAGDTIYAPAGVEHGLKNNGENDIILLANFPNYKS